MRAPEATLDSRKLSLPLGGATWDFVVLALLGAWPLMVARWTCPS